MSIVRHEIGGLLAAYIAKGAVGASFAYAYPGRPLETVTAGEADRRHRTPVRPDHLFKIGSCTKTFVAAALVRLSQDGDIDLGAPISKWFPDLTGGDRISVRQLVNHRSGLPEFEYDIPMTPGRVWKPEELVDLAFKAGKQSSSGGPAVYNNTGYVLAGMLIEAVTGRSLGAYVREVILCPLGLSNTFSPATESYPADRMVRGYYHRPPPVSGYSSDIASGSEMWRMDGVLPHSNELQDSTGAFPYSAAYGCGDMVSTSSDLVTFMQALFAGLVVSRNMFEEMFGSRVSVSFPGTRMRETGAGLFRSDYGGRAFYGHQGSIPGYVCVMQHDPAKDLTVAMTSNIGSGNRLSFEASGLHHVVDQAIERLLSDERE